MTDLISRQAAIDGKIKIQLANGVEIYSDEAVPVEYLKRLPSAEPVRHGKWIDDGQYDNFFPHHEWRCSECGEHVLEIGTPWFKYCPFCGARMDKDD